MAALVVLTGRLPGHTQPGGDLWPPDAQTNSLVNQLRECRFCPLLCNPGALDLLQHLGGRHPGSRLRLAWRLRWRLVAAAPAAPAWLSGSIGALLVPRDPGCGRGMTTRVASLLPGRLAVGTADRVLPLLRHVTWVTFFEPDGLWRTVTDACGLLRTLATWPTRAAGVCIWRTSAAQWIPEPGEGRRRCRAESPGAPASSRSPSRLWDVLTCGVSSPSTPPSPEASA